jgi:hypothetical protein
MIASRPPRLADWFLLRLASGPRHPSLIGDLHEQYGRGRSTGWYWRQTVKAILVGIGSDLRRHPVELFHALCTGLGSWTVYSMLIQWPAWWLFQRSALDSKWLRTSGAIQWAFLLLALLVGWVVGRTVLRFHRERLAAALLLLIVAGTATNLPRLFSLSVDAWGYSNYRTYLFSQITSLAIPLVGILIGGLSDLRPSEQNFQINNGISAE